MTLYDNFTNSVFSDTLEEILTKGSVVATRNSETKRIKNKLVTFNKTPLVSLRTTAWKSALREMEWFLSGSNDINDLHESVRKWWEPWANSGKVANNYSVQFRERGIDQIQYMIDTIINEPTSRRNVISTWDTYDMTRPETPITNCHGTTIQAFVEGDNSLHLTMYQRSADMVLGVPHNWVQYWAMLLWLANRTGKVAGSFTWVGGDCHIYKEHYELAQKMVGRFDDRYKEKSCNLLYSPSSREFVADDFMLDSKYLPIVKDSAKMIV